MKTLTYDESVERALCTLLFRATKNPETSPVESMTALRLMERIQKAPEVKAKEDESGG